MDAIELGLHECELTQCDFTVGYGGSPNEYGETTLDAIVMNAQTRAIGAVANLKRVKGASRVARQVMEQTYHSLLVGEDATDFAKRIGFKTENLTTEYSLNLWKQWLAKGKQPNYWKNQPPPPPSVPMPNIAAQGGDALPMGHDTIGMILMNDKLETACGTSTNGLSYRIPGRVGDSPYVILYYAVVVYQRTKILF